MVYGFSNISKISQGSEIFPSRRSRDNLAMLLVTMQRWTHRAWQELFLVMQNQDFLSRYMRFNSENVVKREPFSHCCSSATMHKMHSINTSCHRLAQKKDVRPSMSDIGVEVYPVALITDQLCSRTRAS